MVPSTGELVDAVPMDQHSEQVEALTAQITRLERSNRQLKQTLRADRDEARTDNDRLQMVRRIVANWRTVCGHPQAMVTEERAKAILKALDQGYTEQRFARACQGARAFPFVIHGAGRATSGKRSERYDDVSLIARKIEAFEKLADRAELGDEKLLRPDFQRRDDNAPAEVEAHDGFWYRQAPGGELRAWSETSGRWIGQCPVCRLALKMEGRSSPMELGCVSGCDPEAVRDALRPYALRSVAA
jgi:hypothetical protein